MTKKSPAKSPLMESIHETAKGMYKHGLISGKKMLKFDALCLAQVPEYDANKVKALRGKYKLSQASLASVLNTSVSTIRQWEIGDKHPSGPSKKLLNILERKGLEAFV